MSPFPITAADTKIPKNVKVLKESLLGMKWFQGWPGSYAYWRASLEMLFPIASFWQLAALQHTDVVTPIEATSRTIHSCWGRKDQADEIQRAALSGKSKHHTLFSIWSKQRPSSQGSLQERIRLMDLCLPGRDLFAGSAKKRVLQRAVTAILTTTTYWVNIQWLEIVWNCIRGWLTVVPFKNWHKLYLFRKENSIQGSCFHAWNDQ